MRCCPFLVVSALPTPCHTDLVLSAAAVAVLSSGNCHLPQLLHCFRRYVYDSLVYPFYRAEGYHQFHTNDVLQRPLPDSYTKTLKQVPPSPPLTRIYHSYHHHTHTNTHMSQSTEKTTPAATANHSAVATAKHGFTTGSSLTTSAHTITIHLSK